VAVVGSNPSRSCLTTCERKQLLVRLARACELPDEIVSQLTRRTDPPARCGGAYPTARAYKPLKGVVAGSNPVWGIHLIRPPVAQRQSTQCRSCDSYAPTHRSG
jgi:hypothetical protein